MSQAGGWLTSRVLPIGKVRVPSVRRIFGGQPAPAFAAGAGTTSSTNATVATDKGAYVPNSHVVTSGGGWQANSVVTLTFTELSTTVPNETLHGPVSVYATTGADGSFSSAGDPNSDFTTDTKHDGTVTMQVTAAGPDAAGANVSVNSAPFTNGVTVSTDEGKYSVGEPMTISGAGYTPGGSVTVSVTRPDHLIDTLTPPLNGGTFSVVYQPPAISGRYKITATDGVYTAKVAVTEADALGKDFSQCSNANNTVGACKFINGILQKTNSIIVEGMSTLQRLMFDTIPPTGNNVHVMTFHMDSVKAGSHAYDFLTTWEAAIDATNKIVPANGALGNTVPLYPAIFKSTGLAAAQAACAGVPDTGGHPTPYELCLANRQLTGNTVAVATQDPANYAGFPVLGDNIAAVLDSYQTNFETDDGPVLLGANFTKRKAMRLYGNQAISNAIVQFTGIDAQGQSHYTLTWTSASTAILFEFAAHVAEGVDTTGFGLGYGSGRGAANINGGPYHVSMDTLDGASLGNLDNQLQGASVLTPPGIPELGSTLTGAVLGGKVEVGGQVHDTANIAITSGTQNIPPGSTVTFKLYKNLTCSDPVFQTYGPISVPSGSQTANVDSPSFTPTGGDYSYKVTFTSGSESIVKSGEAPCEPFTVIAPATTLTLKSQTPNGANLAVGTVVTIVVTETNTGNDPLTNVSVTAGGKCTTSGFTGGATSLAVGASTEFTCTFTVAAGPNGWSGDGQGTDSLGNAVPSTGEHVEGSVTGLATSTSLTLVSATPNPAAVGGTVTVVVKETNTGGTSLTNVNVTGGGKCTSFTGGATTLAAGANTDFTCTFTADAGANAWSADGHGTNQFGQPAPDAGEHVEGSVTGLATSTSLTLVSATPNPVAVGGTVTVVVKETNTGGTSLTNVNVTGGGKCTSFTGGATTLAAGANTDFTCTFTADAGANAWSADGHGTNQFGQPAPDAGEHVEGSVTGLTTSTSLTLVSATPNPVAFGGTVTVVVKETNTGGTSLTNVNVTGGGRCASFTGGASTLAAGANTNFTCTFTADAGANAWSADGHGTNQFGQPAPDAGEHVEGSVRVVLPATTLVTRSVSPSTTVLEGTQVTVVVRETNVGNGPLTNVNVSGGGACTSFTPANVPTLLANAFQDFTCTFTPTTGPATVAWSAEGHGTDELGNAAPATNEQTSGSVIVQRRPRLTIIKTIKGTSQTFGYHVTGANTITTTLKPNDNSSAQYGPVVIEVGNSNVISEDTPLPSGWTLTDVSCTDNGTLINTAPAGPGPNDNNGVPTNWTFPSNVGSNIVCTYVNNQEVVTTRTQGFWATHTALANAVWGGNGTTYPVSGKGGSVIGTDPSIIGSPDSYLCGVQITALTTPDAENVLMGGFWAQNSKLADGTTKRSAADQARIQMLQQYLAAVLNVHMFGSGPVDLAGARAAYCGPDTNANLKLIQSFIGTLSNFNQKGDSGTFTPGASASPAVSKKQADIDAWDTPKNPVD